MCTVTVRALTLCGVIPDIECTVSLIFLFSFILETLLYA